MIARAVICLNGESPISSDIRQSQVFLEWPTMESAVIGVDGTKEGWASLPREGERIDKDLTHEGFDV